MDSYQYSIDDMKYIESLSNTPGRTAYIDESGSFGFDFTAEGVSTHYIVCAVIVDNTKIREIENKVDQIRKNRFGSNEMKSSQIGKNNERRYKVLMDLLALDFSIIVMIADKKAFISQSPLTEYKGTFVKYLHKLLYESMSCAYPKLKIIEDEFGTSEFQQGYKEYIRKNRPEPNLFNDYSFDYADSKHSNIVQIADIIAGSISRHIADPESPDVLRIFESRIREIISFPKVYSEVKVPQESSNEYDSRIYNLALKCAYDYINANRNTISDDVRLRVLFLKLLIFRAENFNPNLYIYSGEIVNHLSSVSEKKITRDYLYRKIIAKLRDEGVLIASSSHGYKMPTCVRDIYAYIAQTDSIVAPMLSRIKKCRIQILKETDGMLDILDSHELMSYKRFFGDY